MGRLLDTALLLALLTLPACSEPAPDEAQPKPGQLPATVSPPLEPPTAVDPPPVELPLPEWFERSLAPAPLITREAVLSACSKWTRLDGSCDAVAARRGQIRCWRLRGESELRHAQNLGLKRRRSIDHKIMLMQNLCMEMHGWRKRESRAGA